MECYILMQMKHTKNLKPERFELDTALVSQINLLVSFSSKKQQNLATSLSLVSISLYLSCLSYEKNL